MDELFCVATQMKFEEIVADKDEEENFPFFLVKTAKNFSSFSFYTSSKRSSFKAAEKIKLNFCSINWTWVDLQKVTKISEFDCELQLNI